MANIYVRSTDGNNGDNGSTWALAKADLTGAAAIDVAGDSIYVSQNHAESTAGALSLAFAGNTTSPSRIVCVNDGAEPPTAVATTGTVTTTGNNGITVSATTAYFYGLGFVIGSGGTGTASFLAGGGGNSIFENCSFHAASTGNSTIQFGNTASRYEVVNCSFKFGAAGSALANGGGGFVLFRGGSLLSGGTSPSTLLTSLSAGVVIVDGLDLTNASSSINLCNSGTNGVQVTFRNCKLPASWSGSLHSSTPGLGSVFQMFNCDSGDTNYRYRRATQWGTIQEETTLVRTGGASDGTTTYSWKLVSNTNAEYPVLTLDTPEIVRWNDTTGSAITATVEILRDSATNLKDDEIWLEVMYLGTSGFPLGGFITDAKADVLATAADQTASSETWTTTGMGNPNKQKLSVTFTPQEKGFIHARVRLARASTTVYVDPVLTVS